LVEKNEEIKEFAKCQKEIGRPPPTLRKRDGGVASSKNWRSSTPNPKGHPVAAEGLR
jgi:hypothetical protein